MWQWVVQNELVYVVAFFAEGVCENVQGEILPAFLLICDFSIALTTKAIKLGKLFFQCFVGPLWWPVRWFWRRLCAACHLAMLHEKFND